MALVIDSHHHFWKYSPKEYSWIGEGGVLKHDFLPADLKMEIDAGVGWRCQRTGATDFGGRALALELAEKNDFIRA